MTPLHVHSNYTLLKGTARIEELIDKAKINHLDSLALTDTNGMYGLIPFAKKAKEHKIQEAIFDKGRYKYHGRVKAFAESAREGGLKI